MDSEPAKAFSYVRMSSEVQLKGDSLRRQREASRRYAEAHGLKLVEEEELKDIGVSAFTGDNVKTGAMGVFLNLIRTGKIPAGSYLLLESLDRLSRQHPMEALNVFLQILNSDIKIVTLIDEKVFSKGMDVASIMMSIGSMARAHEESAVKSKRLTESWSNKRNNIQNNKLTAMCPLWLKLSEDRRKFIVNQEAAKTITRIFNESAGGVGLDSIERMFNRESIPTFGRSEGWHKSYIVKIIQNRAVLGEFQPHRYEAGKRVKVGEAISDYYPRIVSDELFYRAHDAIRGRRAGGGGRKGNNVTNLFAHIIKCAYCNAAMRVVNKGVRGGRHLICSSAIRGIGCERIPWEYNSFEDIFLSHVREIDIASTLDADTFSGTIEHMSSDIAILRAKSYELQKKLSVTYEGIVGDNGAADAFLMQQIRKIGQEKGEIDKKLTEIEHKRESEESKRRSFYESSGTISELIDKVTRSSDDMFHIRSSLAQRLRDIIDEVSVSPGGGVPIIRSAIGKIEIDLERASSIADRKRLLSAKRALAKEMQEPSRNDRNFTVWFKNGKSRAVYVESSKEAKVSTFTVESSGPGFTFDK